MRGRFLILDGLDGIGKGVFLDAMRAEAEREGLRILDLHEFWRTHGRHPDLAEVDGVDILLSSEPTYVGEGKRIREELIRKGTAYPARLIAEAYAEDRRLLYAQAIIPALERGITVLQSRGVTTSLVYQPLDAERKGERLTRDEVAALPGNAFCLRPEVLPDLLLIPTVRDAKEAVRRLADREKQDDATFETYAFQLRVKEAFESDGFRRFFEERGVRVVYPDAERSIAHSRAEAVRLYRALTAPGAGRPASGAPSSRTTRGSRGNGPSGGLSPASAPPSRPARKG